MGQLGDASLVDEALKRLDSLHPAFLSIIEYLRNLRKLSTARSSEIGAKVFDLLQDSLISELDYPEDARSPATNNRTTVFGDSVSTHVFGTDVTGHFVFDQTEPKRY